jgi:programmed cell death 6-interacting protein
MSMGVCDVGSSASRVSKMDATRSESVIQAGQYYRTAMGTCDMMRDLSATRYGRNPPSLDFHVDVLQFLCDLSAAQLQECIALRGMAANMSSAAIASISASAGDVYARMAESVRSELLSQCLDKSWVALIIFKQSYYKALSQYHQAQAAVAEQKHGEAIPRLAVAAQLARDASLSAAQTDPMLASIANQLVARASNEHGTLTRENAVVYQQRVCTPAELLPIQQPPRQQIQTGSVVDVMDPKFGCADPFERILSPECATEYARFRSECGDIVREESQQSQQSLATLTSTLQSLNLPAALDVLSKPVDVPQPLLVSLGKIRNNGGTAALHETLQKMKELGNQLSDKLTAVEGALGDEAAKDGEIRTRFGANWKASSSATLNATMFEEAKKLRNYLSQAANADGIIARKLLENQAALAVTDQSEEAVMASIPAAPVGAAGSASAATCPEEGALRATLERCDQVRSSLESAAKQLQSAVDSDTSIGLFSAAFKDGTVPALIQRRKEELLGAQRAELAGLRTSIPQLLSTVRSQSDALNRVRGGAGGLSSPRAVAVGRIQNGVEKYLEISANQDEGLRFYQSITKKVDALKSQVDDFCYARHVERVERLPVLQNMVAAMRIRDDDGSQSGGPPARPPPPASTAPTVSAPPPSHSAPSSGMPAYGAPPQGHAGYAPSSAPPPSGPYPPQHAYGDQHGYGAPYGYAPQQVCFNRGLEGKEVHRGRALCFVLTQWQGGYGAPPPNYGYGYAPGAPAYGYGQPGPYGYQQQGPPPQQPPSGGSYGAPQGGYGR